MKVEGQDDARVQELRAYHQRLGDSRTVDGPDPAHDLRCRVDVQGADQRDHVVATKQLIHVGEAIQLPERIEHLRLSLGLTLDQHACDHELPPSRPKASRPEGRYRFATSPGAAPPATSS